MTSFFIFGAGYSGQAFAKTAPDSAKIAGTTRSADKFDRLGEAGIEPHLFSGEMTPELAGALRGVTHLIVSIAPDEAGDPVLNAARDLIATRMPDLAWIGYLSTVGVYGDHGGAWVDEAGECRPVSGRSKLRLKAEDEWRELGKQISVPVAVLRLSGIYGPGRNAFVNLSNGTAKRLVKKDQVFNRVHAADIAGALWHLAGGKLGGIFNITDDLPAPPQDVVTYAATLMDVEPPPEIPFETAELSPMARSFYGENKRVANVAIKATGYAFRYPDYKAAFDAMWAEGNWKGAGREDARSPIRRS